MIQIVYDTVFALAERVTKEPFIALALLASLYLVYLAGTKRRTQLPIIAGCFAGSAVLLVVGMYFT